MTSNETFFQTVRDMQDANIDADVAGYIVEYADDVRLLRAVNDEKAANTMFQAGIRYCNMQEDTKLCGDWFRKLIAA